MNQHVQIKLAKAQIAGVLEALAHHLSGDDDELKLDMLEGSTDLNEIVSHLLSQNEDDEGMIGYLDKQIDDRAVRKERLQNRIEARKKAIVSLMDTAAITKLPLPEATLSLRTLKGRPKIVDPDALPDAFVDEVVTLKANMEAIKEAVERGEAIPGVIVTNGSSSLTVRRK